ncbi:vanin-like protein 2 [Chelonus insularis]|uniref:vanin-like protein 2 n=1 Tax=Chelonus insularis TaxID=460826 RepID=UPI00158DA2E0|nr:vanin-like protein 2 [Chelonus insularis]
MNSLFFILLSIFHLSYQKSSLESQYYTATVVEYGALDPTNPQDSPVEKNGEIYRSYIEEAGKHDADIIVFPEDGLTSVNLPDRDQMDTWATLVPLNYTPCNQTTIQVHKVLSLLSCAAVEAQIYVVVNIAEKLPCNVENCPRDKVLYYNCQVVFDRDGKIIAKYRKTNLFSEPQFNVTPEPEIVTFQTDFGVTFGTFICFDILFKEPGITLTRKLNITDIVYSTAWFSELPFLSAIQTQYGWSYAEDVNFLASGYNRVEFGNGGSGIYLGRNGICKTKELSAGNELIICNVPKKNRNIDLIAIDEAAIRLHENRKNAQEIEHVHDELRKREISDIQLYHDDLSLFKSIPLNSSLQHTLCDGNFCCDFDVDISYTDSNSIYKLVAYDGIRTFIAERRTVGIQTCAVVQCANDSITSCGLRSNSQTTFNYIQINATFIDYADMIILPSSVDVDLLPLVNWTYKEYFDDNKVHITASLDSNPVKDLLTCGIYIRIFSRDVETTSRMISTLQIATIIALVAISIFFLFLYRKGWRVPIRRGSQANQEPYHSLQSTGSK